MSKFKWVNKWLIFTTTFENEKTKNMSWFLKKEIPLDLQDHFIHWLNAFYLIPFYILDN